MKSLKRAILLGLAVWAVPFVVAVLVYSFHEPWRSLFESVMAVTVATTAVFFGWLHLRRLVDVQPMDGLKLGVLWWVICVVIDLFMFSAGPMQMATTEYFADIGLTYVMIPVITTGLAMAFNHRR